MLDFYVLQRNDFGIGNFINCTPTLQTLYNHYQEKIPVYFCSQVVSEIFFKCPFIFHIDRKKYNKEYKQRKCLFTSGMKNAKIPDWKYIHNEMTKKLEINVENIPHTYVDKYSAPRELKNKKYAVIVRGAINNKWNDLKVPDIDIYQHIIDQIYDNYELVFIGSHKDEERLDPLIHYKSKKHIYLNDMKASLGIINNAQFIISNDTGMYHVAGALNKPIFVMWKNTLFEKNKSPGKYCFFSFQNKWKEDFDFWFNSFQGHSV